MEKTSRPALGALFLALALVLCAWILSRSWVRVRSGDEIVSVTGSARRAITSDFIIWNGTLSRTAKTPSAAYSALQNDVAKTRAYLVKRGVAAQEIVALAVDVKTLYVPRPPVPQGFSRGDDSDTIRPVAGYALSQSIEIRSSNVALVDTISRESTQLLEQGLSFSSQSPMYLYTKLSDLKVKMQAEAAADARARADGIAKSAGASLGAVRYARMTAPSITPLYSAQENDGGVDDTSALEKKITAIVSIGYAIR